MESEVTAELGQKIQSLAIVLSQQRGLEWRERVDHQEGLPCHSHSPTQGQFPSSGWYWGAAHVTNTQPTPGSECPELSHHMLFVQSLHQAPGQPRASA